VKSADFEGSYYVVFLGSCYFLPHNPKYCHPTPFPNLSLCSSLSVRDQVSHPCKISGNIVVLYNLMFTVLIEDQKLEDFEAFLEFNLSLIFMNAVFVC
jgi:hypothetical protein